MYHVTQAQANSNYLNIRTNYFSLISPSVPIFLALGNHEQEEGWHMGDPGFAVEPPIMSANARNEYFLNPDPLISSFYTGNTDTSYSGITDAAATTRFRTTTPGPGAMRSLWSSILTGIRPPSLTSEMKEEEKAAPRASGQPMGLDSRTGAVPVARSKRCKTARPNTSSSSLIR